MAYPLNYEAGATQAPLIRLLQRNLEKPVSYIVSNNTAANRKPSSAFSLMSLTVELLQLRV
jgi:hypothetical protein